MQNFVNTSNIEERAAHNNNSSSNFHYTIVAQIKMCYTLCVEDLRQIIEQIADGDKNALKRFISIKGGFIKSVAFNILNDRQLCEDALNEVIIKIWSNAYKIKAYKNIEGFIYTVSYNAAIDIKRKNRHFLPVADEIINSVSDHSNIENDTLEKITVHKVLEKLAEDERQILILNSLYGYNFFDCAKAMELSYFKARSLCIKAKQKFKEYYIKQQT